MGACCGQAIQDQSERQSVQEPGYGHNYAPQYVKGGFGGGLGGHRGGFGGRC